MVYLGEMVRKDGCSEEEVRRRTQAGANARGKVGGGTVTDRNVSKKLKGKDCSAKNQQKLNVCENNWVRIITQARRVDGRRRLTSGKRLG